MHGQPRALFNAGDRWPLFVALERARGCSDDGTRALRLGSLTQRPPLFRFDGVECLFRNHERATALFRRLMFSPLFRKPQVVPMFIAQPIVPKPQACDDARRVGAGGAP